jgi:GT2 family glycosyltransferase
VKLSFKPRRIGAQASSDTAEAGKSRALQAQAAGDAARDRQDWIEAASHYARALEIDRSNFGLTVQYGNVLKDSGQFDAAIGAYRQAIALDGQNADVYLQLGHANKLANQPEAAIEAYAQALEIDPDFSSAYNELIAMGARDRLPSSITGRQASTQSLARLQRLIEQGLEAARTLNSLSTYAVGNYDLFRRRFPIQPPPDTAHEATVLVVIEARTAPAVAVRETLKSLQDQRHRNWRALVLARQEVIDHPVASLAITDTRIEFALSADQARASSDRAVLLDAGTLLDPEALGWLSYSAHRTGADLVYADHDHYEAHWQYGLTRRDPVLLPMFDPDEADSNPWTPATILVCGQLIPSLWDSLETLNGQSLRRALLVSNLADLKRAHLPRLLSTCPQAEAEAPVPVLTPRKDIAHKGRILVVIPTRDALDILIPCIDSLIAKASRPERLDIVVVNNRSDQANREGLAALEAAAKARILDVDEPFNWSRLNNLAVEAAPYPADQYAAFVFANNDIEAISSDWDDQLDRLLADPSVGTIGVRLIYPNGLIQHAGILLGGYMNRPVHDGLKCNAAANGPLNRLKRTRGVAGVTGAFMAVKPELFKQVGGFDVGLAIAYNDVDFCLKVRAAGYRVVYSPEIELYHYESLTRGASLMPEKMAWDDSEFASLYGRWGEWLFFDPTRNPHWTSHHEQPFEGFRDLTQSQILHSLDLSARPAPWAIDHQ